MDYLRSQAERRGLYPVVRESLTVWAIVWENMYSRSEREETKGEMERNITVQPSDCAESQFVCECVSDGSPDEE